jgi:hypothetical protein
MIASKPRKAHFSGAPRELTRHIPVYRAIGTVVAILAASSVMLMVTLVDAWVYPGPALLSVAVTCAGGLGALGTWVLQPESVTYTSRQSWWHEYTYYSTTLNRLVNRVELGDVDPETMRPLHNASNIIVWRYIGSTYAMGFGLLALAGLVGGIISLGYLSNPI